MKHLSKFLWILVVLAVLFRFGSPFFLREVVQTHRITSPDGAWEAIVTNWDYPTTLWAPWYYSIELRPTGYFGWLHTSEIYQADGYDYDHPPQISWKDTRTLCVVSHAKHADSIYSQVVKHEDVTILYNSPCH